MPLTLIHCLGLFQEDFCLYLPLLSAAITKGYTLPWPGTVWRAHCTVPLPIHSSVLQSQSQFPRGCAVTPPPSFLSEFTLLSTFYKCFKFLYPLTSRLSQQVYSTTSAPRTGDSGAHRETSQHWSLWHQLLPWALQLDTGLGLSYCSARVPGNADPRILSKTILPTALCSTKLEILLSVKALGPFIIITISNYPVC